MAKAFRRRRDGTIAATLHVEEAQLLHSLVGQLVELLADGQARPAAPTGEGSVDQTLAAALDLASPEPPEDPVLHRLLPDAYHDDADADAARDFRRYTEHGLRDVKRRNAEVVLASLAGLSAPATGRGGGLVVVLDGDQAQAWLRTLTDLRLALGVRLGVQEGDEERWEALPDDDPKRYVHQIFGWLGWLQQTLVEARMAQRGWRR